MPAIYLITFSSYSQASLSSLVETDWVPGSGDHKTTLDTRTGLEWLDLTETRGQSVFSVLTGYGNWINNGFRYATGVEVASLLETAEVNIAYGTNEWYAAQAVDSIKLQSLVNMIGETKIFNRPEFHTQGYIADPYLYYGHPFFDYVNVTAFGGQAGYWYSIGIHDSYASPSFTGATDTAITGFIGSFLVRDVAPVPIPASIWLFGSALTFFGASCRRRTI